MAAGRKTDQLIVIVGPTASGKSSLAVKVAKQYDGEVISADSRAIYKGLSIGTAKPTLKERAGVPHYGFDLMEPNEAFSAAQFQQHARVWITDIQSRHKLPVMVGGTGLYIDSILFDYAFGFPANKQQRYQLEKLSLEELWEYCEYHNIKLPENKQNKRYVIRAIELGGINKQRAKAIRKSTFVVGLNPGKEKLQQLIYARAETMFKQNVVIETSKIAKKYGWQSPALSGNIYPIIRRLIDNEITFQAAIEQSAVKDWQLAKRQLTWFKRDPHIHWYSSAEQAYLAVKEYLSKFE